MQRILRKRVWRDLKKDLFRYLALAFLIILGMYMIISLVGAADTIITGVNNKAEENFLEDGEFGVFIPLTQSEQKKLTDQGISLEKMFYLEYLLDDTSILRVYQIRTYINKICLDEGSMPANDTETVLEKRYCEEHQLSVGDTIEIGNQTFTIAGIGTVPDYDCLYKEMTDSSSDSMQFGLSFVNSEAYQNLNELGNSTRSEEYVYAYRLNGTMNDEELKSQLKDLDFSADQVDDPYFKKYWERTAGKAEDLENGIEDLHEGSDELSKALNTLCENNEDIQEATGTLLNNYLAEATEGLESYGLSRKLTEENFETELKELKEGLDNAFLRLKIQSVLEQLQEIKTYKDGINDYTDGVSETNDGMHELADGMDELYDSVDEIKEAFDIDVSNLTQFVKASENPRIKASSADQVINKYAGLIAGIIIMILFTYVISVFVIHGIEKESSVIGALYALGVKKKDLMVHYLMLPVIVTFVAGLIGTALGFSTWGVNYQMQDCYDYFSIPTLNTVYPVYLLIYGIVMPSVVAILVNIIVIRRKLSQPALQLLRNQKKNVHVENINLGNMSFIKKFRIRQMMREARTGFTVLFGMFISMLIMMLGINCYVMCENISIESKRDTKYEYMYTYKYPDESVPEGGEACYAKTLKKEIYGFNLDVTLLGIDSDNPYFDVDASGKANEVIVSSAMAQKYGLTMGDSLILTDGEEDKDYVFRIKNITQYMTGFFVFMDIDSMRELYGASDDYYNVVFSDHVLDIDSGKLYATKTKDEIHKSSDVFISMMMPMVYMMTVVSALIFCIVMYLMMKVMIDRSSFHISLIKIFGFRTNEVKKLYLNGNFYLIAVGAAICIPLSKKLMDSMYPWMVSNVACGMNLTFSWQLYLGIYLAVIVLYLMINQLLVRQLNKMTPAEVLKDRE